MSEQIDRAAMVRCIRTTASYMRHKDESPRCADDLMAAAAEFEQLEAENAALKLQLAAVFTVVSTWRNNETRMDRAFAALVIEKAIATAIEKAEE